MPGMAPVPAPRPARGQHSMGAPLFLEPREGLKDHILVPKASRLCRAVEGGSRPEPIHAFDFFKQVAYVHDSEGHAEGCLLRACTLCSLLSLGLLGVFSASSGTLSAGVSRV